MILRRISEAIRNQDWFVVVLEIMIVVVGIFIGLQVDDWNEARKNDALEVQFLERLHSDVMEVEQQASRLKDRRINRFPEMLMAMDVLFNPENGDPLDEAACGGGVIGTDFFTFNISGLPALDELMASGRMYILKDETLTRALVDWEQSRTILDQIIQINTMNRKDFLSTYPELITATALINEGEDGEIRMTFTCDTSGMRSNQAFLNDFSSNLDQYDAYLRDGLLPWVNRFDKIHTLLDDKLELHHGEDT